MTSRSTRTWHFGASLLTDGASGTAATSVRVIALRANEAARMEGARERVEMLYQAQCAASDYPMGRVMSDIAKAFEDDSQHNYAVLAYIDNGVEGADHDGIVACTRVSSCGARVTVSSIAVDQELTTSQQHAITRAIAVASDELAQTTGKAVLQDESSSNPRSIMIWQAQVGASDYVKRLHDELGYRTELAQRLEMTAFLNEKGAEAKEDTVPVDDTSEITFRPWDLVKDDFELVYDVLKRAFGSNPPSLEAWKRHFAQHPRFADELSIIAWHGDYPACVVAVEYMVDGEGGGAAELAPLFATDRQLAEEDIEALSPVKKLQFPEDYEERKAKIRAAAKTASVCCVGTSPQYRGKRLGQKALRLSIQKAAQVGLETMYLSTDRQNPAAVRAYTRAGMEVTKVTDLGNMTAKEVTLDP